MSLIITSPVVCTFFHIPKTGGTSIRKWLSTNFDYSDTGIEEYHLDFDQTKKFFGNNLGTKFCVVRNPYDRWISSFFEYYKFHDPSVLDDATYRDIQQGFLGFMYNAKHNNYHLNHQWNVAQNCDIILRYENLDKDFCQIQNLLSNFTKLPKENVNPYKYDYDKIFKRSTISLINDLSELEFTHLGYKRINNISI